MYSAFSDCLNQSLRNMASIFKVKDVVGQKYCVFASTLKELKVKGKPAILLLLFSNVCAGLHICFICLCPWSVYQKVYNHNSCNIILLANTTEVEEDSTIKEKAKIYNPPKKQYKVAVNNAAISLAMQDPALILQKGKSPIAKFKM